MKRFILQLSAIGSLAFTLNSFATTRYVDANGTNPAAPYTSWATAATNIQSAVDIASTADLILVTNGIYQTGGRFSDSVSNRVVINTFLTVRSVNGPMVTTIRGYQLGNSHTLNAVRCVNLHDGVVLSGFTLTNGSANGISGGFPYPGYGAGVYCLSTNCLITNCIIAGNVATSGGGVYRGTLVNCVLTGNIAGSSAFSGDGGGAYSSTLINCVLTGNGATYAGGGAEFCTLINCTVVNNVGGSGVVNSTLKNCIVYYNSPNNNSPPGGGNFTNCCVFPLPLGANNFTNAPQFVNLSAGDLHLQPWSPCINTGDNSLVASSLDLDGNPRIFAGTVDIGAYENYYTGTVHYVRWQTTNAIIPYSSWSTAATNIQDAVGVAQSGEFVIVGDGNYTSGSTVVSGQTPNCVALTNDITVLSLNGPQATTINGGLKVRCAYVGSNALLSGFTLTLGGAPTGGGAWSETGGVVSNCLITFSQAVVGGGTCGGTIYASTLTRNSATSGGGAFLSALFDCTISSNSIIAGGNGYGAGAYQCLLSNCTVNVNSASAGGGTYQGTNYNCVLMRNTANSTGGGTCLSTNYSCVLSNNTARSGGGSYDGENYNCLIFKNSGSDLGGGACLGTLYNCMVVSNSAFAAGGVEQGTLYNCTVANNSAVFDSGGVDGSSLHNSIVYYNSAPTHPNGTGTTVDHCCMFPLSASNSSFTNAPLFVDLPGGNLRLQTNSPCINAGDNAYAGTANDFDGNPRIVGGTVDMGAYECQSPALLAYYTWLQGYSLPTDAALVYADSDGDRMNNWQEYLADTSPLDANDFLHITSFTRSGTYNTLWWTSKSTRLYRVQRRETLDDTSSWKTIFTNAVPGWNNVGFDNAGSQYFYRIQAVWP